MSETPALEPQSWSLAGVGNVGEALLDMVAKPEVAARFGLFEHPDFVLRTDGWVFTVGSGAGAGTTANAMLDNSKALRTA